MNMRRYFYNLATDLPPHQSLWYGGGFIVLPIKILLWMLSLIYGLAVRVLIFFYRLKPIRLNCKVISVGNITLGGTGKTALVEFIARYLRSRGHKVAILTRGYKRKITDYGLTISDYEEMGDEPYMLKANLKGIPVIVDADRGRAANLAIREYGVDTVILDDGFQQWRIAKDLDIVTIDVNNPLGNRRLLPRGILREPVSSLGRADLLVLTKINLSKAQDVEKIKGELNRLSPLGLIIESTHKPVGFYDIASPTELFDAKALRGETVTLFSGIGDPDSFEDLITGLGINIGLSFRFPDHYNYTQEDLDKIIKDSRDKNLDTIITTQKDAARLSDWRLATGDWRILVLRIELAIKDEQIFYSRLLKPYSI
jgi:tetraacyldisaccharide 4'-kinase